MPPVTTVSIAILVLAIVFAVKTLKIVPQQHAWVVERLGKFDRILMPGLNIIVPFIDRVAYKHELKEFPLDVPSQVCITRDNTQLQVDGVLYFQVTDPMRASYGSSNYIDAITQRPRPRCAPSSAAWNWTRPSRNARPSTWPSSACWTKPPPTGASRCCAMKSRT